MSKAEKLVPMQRHIIEEERKTVESLKDLNKNTIMCVDDNFVNLSAIKLQLEMSGYKGEIQRFSSTQNALDFIFNND